jgi:hypothetical protein
LGKSRGKLQKAVIISECFVRYLSTLLVPAPTQAASATKHNCFWFVVAVGCIHFPSKFPRRLAKTSKIDEKGQI